MPGRSDTYAGGVIKELRKQRGWSHDRLARELGPPATRQTVIRWEQGSQPSDGYVTKLAGVFGVPEDSFLGRREGRVDDRLANIEDGLLALVEGQKEILRLLRLGARQQRRGA